MNNQVNPSFLLPCTPEDFPGLISFWDFSSSADAFTATQGELYTLKSQTGVLEVIEDSTAPLGNHVLNLQEEQWLAIPRASCPKLDIHGPDGHLTVVAWIRRQKTSVPQCEFIAGQWNESQRGRQYGLFLNISVWGEHNQICGHLSNVGGPTPGYQYCIDGAMGATAIPLDEWVMVAMSYDGQAGFAWLNGQLDARPGLNPYPMAGGLHDGGENGSDFTVGAVDRGGTIGNYFRGQIAGLAVYERALTPAELFALAQL